MSEFFQLLSPMREDLHDIVHAYYVHSESEFIGEKEIKFSPSMYTSLSIYHNATVDFDGINSTTKKDKNAPFCAYLTGYHKNCGVARIETPFRKVGIAFKPLGLNRIVPSKFNQIFRGKPIIEAHCLSFSEDEIEAVFRASTPEGIVEILDELIYKRMNHFEMQNLEDIIELILESEKKIAVTDLEELSNLERRSLLRLFRSHFDCTIVDFIKILRFSKMMENRLFDDEDFNLFDLAYEYGSSSRSQLSLLYKEIMEKPPVSDIKRLRGSSTADRFWNY